MPRIVARPLLLGPFRKRQAQFSMAARRNLAATTREKLTSRRFTNLAMGRGIGAKRLEQQPRPLRIQPRCRTRGL